MTPTEYYGCETEGRPVSCATSWPPKTRAKPTRPSTCTTGTH